MTYSTSAATCPDCGNSQTLHRGEIPATAMFAGRELHEALPGGSLWRCANCHLEFRWPALSKPELDALYAQGAEFAWQGPPACRRDWSIASTWIRKLVPVRAAVLDVGCFDGGFLSVLGPAYRRYGVEIHGAARERAAAKGVVILGSDFADFPSAPEPIACITALDVIEHMQRPGEFLRRCCDVLQPGGRIVMSTGNVESLTFRLMGSRYWYCAIAEHVSFVSPRWCQTVAGALGLELEQYATFSYGRRGVGHWVSDIAKNMVYRQAPSIFGWLRKHGLGGLDVGRHPILKDYPPGWGSARDHFIALFRKVQ